MKILQSKDLLTYYKANVRLDFQPLFGKQAGAPPLTSSRGGTKTRCKTMVEIEPKLMFVSKFSKATCKLETLSLFMQKTFITTKNMVHDIGQKLLFCPWAYATVLQKLGKACSGAELFQI